MHISAPVTNISRGSLHDGPGVRTVVYLKGCGLNCKWCHNPETISQKSQILYIPSKCIHCGACIEVCPEHHIISEGNMIFIREGCTACGKCATACPSMALTLCGGLKTCDEVFDEIKKDLHYYKSSNGGVTFSGGECLLYPDFTKEVFKKCKEIGIHTAIESAFYVPWKNVEAVIPYTDLFFADLKIADSEKHKKYTGQDNKLIIENIKKLSNRFDNIIIRIPVIPTVNDSLEDFDGFAEILKSFGNGIKEVELLKYNNMAESKYSFSGKEYTKFADESQSKEQMEEYTNYLAKMSGLKCYFV